MERCHMGCGSPGKIVAHQRNEPFPPPARHARARLNMYFGGRIFCLYAAFPLAQSILCVPVIISLNMHLLWEGKVLASQGAFCGRTREDALTYVIPPRCCHLGLPSDALPTTRATDGLRRRRNNSPRGKPALLSGYSELFLAIGVQHIHPPTIVFCQKTACGSRGIVHFIPDPGIQAEESQKDLKSVQ